MVGNGPLEPELRRQAAGAPNIFFAPFQNQTQMPRTYAAADLLVLPSESESWGLAVNEAMCLGLPIIVSHHVGCAQDLVHSGRNGLVFPAGDVEALTRALREACSDPERLQRWGEASRAIIQNYSYEQTTKGLLAALNFCAPGVNRHPPPKRQRAGAVQNLAAFPQRSPARSVLDCGSPLPLSKASDLSLQHHAFLLA